MTSYNTHATSPQPTGQDIAALFTIPNSTTDNGSYDPVQVDCSPYPTVRETALHTNSDRDQEDTGISAFESSLTAEMGRLLKSFEIPKDFSEIKQYIEDCGLQEILSEAVSAIRALFPEEIIRLELSREFDSPSDNDSISVLVRTNRELEESMSLLEKLEDSWWIEQYSRWYKNLNIDVEFV